ncbi:MAG: type II toxin-antitoxin system VapB family antitoxin [Candidatus Dormibacteraeota bacterium]|nr:type II toxin-antitoxin system VapB family antitoxin [Candidatus Dormibacteraeota bacterium]
MSLNIKNPETVRLAHALAEATGETVTGAITVAVRERLERLERPDEKEIARRVELLERISRESRDLWREPFKSTDHGELLYDERGLPK